MKLKQYLCVKDYHPIIHKKNGKVDPTDKPVIVKNDILRQQFEGSNVFESFHDPDIALYEYTILNYSECFELIK